MSAGDRPLILFVPGLLPKPEAGAHRAELLRCLLTGIRRVDASIADTIQATPDVFDIVSWTFDFYELDRDIELDRKSIDALIKKSGPNDADVSEATAWKRRFLRWLYLVGDRLPFAIAFIAGKRVAEHLRDVRRYNGNRHGIADEIRRKLKEPLIEATAGQRPILLIGHSMGSIICYDALWELTRVDSALVEVDLLLTLGSPLGQSYMQKRIKGHDRSGSERYPGGIRQWRNLAAIGDLTSLDRCLANDFDEMIELDLIENIIDDGLTNYFRQDGVLNPHSEYGYLVSERTAHTVVDWWRSFES